MNNLRKAHMVSQKVDKAPFVERILIMVENKLQALMTRITKQTIYSKQDSEILTREQHENINFNSEQVTMSINETSKRILYQLEALQIVLPQNSLPQILTDSKANDLPVIKSFQSVQSKRNLESYIESSFARKDKDRNEALKEIILTLCNESQLQLKSRIFLKGQIEEHFSRTHIADHISVEESKNQTQQYLEKFITQIGQLRQQIETLSQQNQTLIKEKFQLQQKLLINKDQTNFLNPQIIHHNYHTKVDSLKRKLTQGDCQSCFKLSEDNKFIAFKAKKIEDILMKKEIIIKEMSQDFSQELLKYNKVFQNLAHQNSQLKRYINDDLTSLIQNLQTQISHLKSADRYQKFQLQQRKKLTDFIQRQNEHYYTNPKFMTQISRTPSHQYLHKNVFSNCSIKEYLPEAQRSRILMKMPERSKSKQSKQSLQSRPHSFKSYSPNLEMKKIRGKGFYKPEYEKHHKKNMKKSDIQF